MNLCHSDTWPDTWISHVVLKANAKFFQQKKIKLKRDMKWGKRDQTSAQGPDLGTRFRTVRRILQLNQREQRGSRPTRPSATGRGRSFGEEQRMGRREKPGGDWCPVGAGRTRWSCVPFKTTGSVSRSCSEKRWSAVSPVTNGIRKRGQLRPCLDIVRS